MRLGPRLLGLACLVLALPVLAQDAEKPKDKDPPKPPPKAVDKNKYAVVVKQAVKLTKVDAKERTVQVSYKVGEGIGRNARWVDKKDELTLADDVRVLSKFPPERIGDDGKAKKLTPAELSKLRDRRADAYVSDLEQLSAGQTVEVTLSKLKETGPKRPAAKDKNAPAEKEHVYVTQIVILADDRAAPGGDRKPGKK